MDIEKTITTFFKESWKIYINNFVALILGGLIAMIGSILIVTIAPLWYGFTMMSVELAKGKTVKPSDVFKGFDFFFRSWGIGLLSLLIVAIGLVLLIIPGLLLMAMLQYAVVISIMKNKGATDSLQESYNLSKKHFSLTLVLFILLMVLNGIGGALKVGTLLTMPFTALVIAVAVKNLK